MLSPEAQEIITRLELLSQPDLFAVQRAVDVELRQRCPYCGARLAPATGRCPEGGQQCLEALVQESLDRR